MSDRPTPETDDVAFRHLANWENKGDHVREIVFADHMRRVEREREDLSENIVQLRGQLADATRQRDELLAALRELVAEVEASAEGWPCDKARAAIEKATQP